VLLFAIIAALIAWHPWGSEVGGKHQVMRFAINLPLTTPLVSGASTVAISPDGRNIVYLAEESGNPQLFLRPIDQFAGHLIPGTSGALDPFFSPNGEWIGYFVNGKLRKASITGGAPQDICDVPGFMRGGSWLDDNSILFGTINGVIYRVSADGGTAAEATFLDTANHEISHRFPQILPDGKNVLFTIKQSNITSFDEALIGAENLQTHERKILVRGGTYGRYIPTGHILYARGSSVFAVPFDPVKVEVSGTPQLVIEGGMPSPQSGDANFTVSSSGTLVYVPFGSRDDLQVRLEWIDRQGKESPIIDSIQPYGDGTVSPDGQKIAMAMRAANDDIWVYHIPRGTLTRLTFGGGNSDLPMWSPDGNRVLYTSERNRSYSLFAKPWDGSGDEEKIGDMPGIAGLSSPAISPDGKSVAYPRKGDIWIMRTDKGGMSEQFTQARAEEFDPSFSPDGRWLSYSTDETGQPEVCVVPYPRRTGKWQVSTHGGYFGRWLRGGKELIYLEGRTIMSVEIHPGATFDYSVPHKIVELPSFNGFLDPAPDGKRFAFGKLVGQNFNATQVDVVVGWFDELRQKFAVQGGK
jgi:serine/threonine-protein kinase